MIRLFLGCRAWPRRSSAGSTPSARRTPGSTSIRSTAMRSSKNERLARSLNAPYAVTALNDLFTFQLYGLLDRLVVRFGLGEAGALRDALLSGIRGIESLEPVRSVAALAERVRAEPALASSSPGAPRRGGVVGSRRTPRGGAPRRGRRAPARFGDRMLAELKLETPPLAETPALLVAMIGTRSPRARARASRRSSARGGGGAPRAREARAAPARRSSSRSSSRAAATAAPP
jgi:pyruvate,water dikinase